MSDYNEKLKNKLNKIAAKTAKKAAKAHERGEKKGHEVVGTRTTTHSNPRTMSPHTRTENVYAKEEKIRHKGVVKQSKAIDKDYERNERKKKRRSYKGLGLVGRVANSLKNSTGGGRGPRPGGSRSTPSAQQRANKMTKQRLGGRKKESRQAGCNNKAGAWCK